MLNKLNSDNTHRIDSSKPKYIVPNVLQIIENFKTAAKSCKTKFEINY
ncbi:bifunctional permease/carbonic anhydrase [Leptospira mayottensis]|uniref:Bifunctional permease/carbonic anhydrase n=1 Tax=Leptospira mayottensis TaxID=1137606 RepID=A0ABN5NSA6_9LEPT|nr:bifunctional permease/carbonic anhydrase [Leptospira mayottensis]AXR63202.1 bifunctional permease/carbonic anhydrase [Leptospira mayottensis]AZQ01266.1 bifunctional permease/carbonic anhydrase [Leptospira mayottensis 200901116]TGN18110.1 bifunctional permease/carbonic anhydrase [Leptospira mayottensis]